MSSCSLAGRFIEVVSSRVGYLISNVVNVVPILLSSVFVLGCLVGMILVRSFVLKGYWMLLLAGIAAVLVYLWLRLPKVCMLVLALALGITRGVDSRVNITRDHIAFYNEEEVRFIGSVMEEPDIRDVYTNLKIKVEQVEVDGLAQRSRGVVLVRSPRYPEIQYGSKLLISGKLETPFEEEEFSYKDYLANQKIFSVMYRADITVIREGGGNLVLGALFKAKKGILEGINRSLPEPHASLLAGILLGVRRTMPEDFAEALQRTGTTHIIAISGYNITVVANFILGFAKWLGRRLATICAIGVIATFVVLTGATPPVLRAAVMGSLGLIGVLLGRESIVHVLFILTAAVLVFLNPNILKSISFQLSFAATAGLIYLVPVLQRILPWIPESLEEATIITLAAVLVTTPITVYNFGQVSVVTMLANLLVLPVVSLSMFLGGVLILGQGLEVLGLGLITKVLAWISWVPLDYMIRVIEKVAEIPFAVVQIDGFPAWGVVVCYLALAGLIFVGYPVSEKVSV